MFRVPIEEIVTSRDSTAYEASGSTVHTRSTIVNQRVSYATVTEREQLPTREQAIVMNTSEGLTVHDYAVAIGAIILSTNIIAISCISQGRVCIYLKSKEIANSLIDVVKTFKIKECEFEIRPLVSRATRIIISNVEPIIPNHLITEELIKHGVTPASNITHVRAGMNGPGFSHIRSFQRSVLIQPEDLEKIPKSLQIKCEGHLARYCKDTPDTSTVPSNVVNDANNGTETITTERHSSVSVDSVIKNSEDNSNTENKASIREAQEGDDGDLIDASQGDKRILSASIERDRKSSAISHSNDNRKNMMPPSSTKRTLSRSSSQTSRTSGNSEPSSRGKHETKQVVKRPRTAQIPSIVEEMKSLLQLVEKMLKKDQQKYTLSADNLAIFLNEIKNANQRTKQQKTPLRHHRSSGVMAER
ncbi:hypothetical protein QAD02_023570 [Eretmocerus hayati]|uniref:Uncharacterized protein n=1 Tax=Eretmocerus hayati TaxID=131215 RepID=A0ACC2PYC3_9HYME|nr:hypothetical protein QAD02_023570 [Eretmocerus hayati]